MIDTVKILEDYIATLDATLTPTGWTVNGDSTTIETCNTYWLSKGCYVTIDGQEYKIIDFVQNEYITISGTPTEQSFLIPAPKFFHGTYRRVNQELQDITGPTAWKDKFPMIYLYEIFNETYNVDQTTPIDWTASVRLFFFQETDIEDFSVSDDYSKIIRPMRSLTNEFLKDIVSEKSEQFEPLERDYQIINWADFGKFDGNKGSVKALINENVSGIELRIDLPVKKEYISNIKCKCNL